MLIPAIERAEEEFFLHSSFDACGRIPCTFDAYTICNFGEGICIRKEDCAKDIDEFWGFYGCFRQGI